MGPRRYLAATTNEDKVREIRALLEGLPIELVGLDRYPGIPPPDETGATFAENARLKALHYAAATGLPAIADDSGLEIDAMNGAPGIESARFGGVNSSYAEKFHLIYDTLRKVRRPESPARFVCAVAVADGHAIVFEGSGTVDGYIAACPAGSGGFGYDPIFFYPPYGCTFAEVSPEQKAVVSHRGVAFRQLRVHLLDRLRPPGSGLKVG
jgi:XTP/dITP diphosphohydrolase